MENEMELQEWRESAPYWDKHSQTIRTMFAPVTEALIEEAGIKSGQKVLDVAGGAGEPSLTIANVVGPSGSVTCTDAVVEMVATAERNARRLGLTNVVFQQCTADSLPFNNASFDAVVSRLGVMFFPDALAALREMLRVAKAESKLSLVVWGDNKSNPFSYVITNVVGRYVQTTPSVVAAHDAFCFSERGKLATILEEAGARNIRERVLKFDIAAPISPAEFWEMRSATSGTLREKIATLAINKREALANEIEDAVLPFFPDNKMKFPAEMLIVTGNKED
jgi:ubiquinone/menaquinone biosynthesis C-methylase UbiE